MSTERDAELARELSQNESLKAIDEAMPARLERLKKIEQIRRRNLRRQMWGSLCTMLVLVILVILGSLVGVFTRRMQQQALNDAASAQIRMFSQALQAYELNIRSYPTTSQGLQALLTAPSGLSNPSRWKGPYMNVKTLPLDPWDNAYYYELVDADTFVIWSAGADGVRGTEDDITN